MLNGFEGRESLIVNTLGHAAGILIFGNFLALVLWSRSPKRRARRLAILAAALALAWNLASATVLVMGERDTLLERAIAGAAFCALSLLPAVLLDLCLLDRFPALVRTGYVLSAIATVAHAAELVAGAGSYHRAGLGLITVGFGLLTVIAVVCILWSSGENPRVLSSRLLAAMSLFLFAISFVHFSEGQSHQAWSTELAFHHAGIPLALFVLLQDYRFVFLDAFIRFLANGLLAGLFGLALAASFVHLDFAAQAVVATLLLAIFATLRGTLLRLLSRIVFRQADPGALLNELRGSPAAQAADAESYIRESALKIAAFMKTNLALLPENSSVPAPGVVFPALISELPDSKELRRKGVEVVVPLRLQDEQSRSFGLGERQGGRRYLSTDLETLARLAGCVAEQADRIRQTEMQRLVFEAELRALQAQIHPHFLFNALNTLYGIIPRQATEARKMLLNLAEVFRYFLQAEKPYIRVEEELQVIKAYLSIEQLRLGNKLQIAIDVEESALRERIPALSIEPLVENAVKHGIAPQAEGGVVRVEVKREDGGVRVCVHDSGGGFNGRDSHGAVEHAGIGLKNVSRRLELCYGPAARLQIESTPSGSTVSFLTSGKPLAEIAP